MGCMPLLTPPSILPMRLAAEGDATQRIVTVNWRAYDPQLRHYLSLNLQKRWLPLSQAC